MTPTEKLAELGIALPQVAAPVAAYVPAVRTGNYVFTSGQLPFVNGELTHVGRVAETAAAAADVSEVFGAAATSTSQTAETVSPEGAKVAARTCALNALAAVNAQVSIDKIVRVVKVVGFVNSADGFNGQPGVINGASELFGEVFGDAGQHARSAVGVNQLPLDAPVEVEIIVEVAE